MTHRSRTRRTIALLLRDALGRFMRVLPAPNELAASIKRSRVRCRRPVVASSLQLALF